MSSIFKKIIPKKIMNAYHYMLGFFSSYYYGKPSEKLIVIGVTGTNGKSTTVRLIAEVLMACGKKVGFISTAEIQIGSKRVLNDLKMTMPGKNILQKFLKDMVSSQCEYAVIETSSQGVEQFRHIGINYDVAVFTNLTPEHIEAHKGFENYKNAKGKFFSHLTHMGKKRIYGKVIDKVSIVNLDDSYAPYFLQFNSDKKVGYTIKASYDIHGVEEIRAHNVVVSSQNSRFSVLGEEVSTNLLGLHNVYNALSALSVGHALGMDAHTMKKALNHIIVPGRMEFIEEGQDFKILIDYAPEPQGISKLYKTVEMLDKKNIIHVLGSCGGGRDRARRKVLGKMAGKFAQYVIVTNEDPYDDDPMEIINEVAQGARELGKIPDKNLFTILERREAIKKAFALAHSNDLVLITGKGCEQAIVVKNNQKIPWDDRVVAREELKKIKR